MKKAKVNMNRKYSKPIWLGWGVIGCVILQILFYLLFTHLSKYIAYSIDNYRYVFSSLLQVIGSMFAFIASSTLVAYQFIASFSPNAVNYYPKRLFILFLVITLIVVGIDVSAILLLKLDITPLCIQLYNFLASFNTYPIVMALVYVLFVLETITPRNQLYHLLKKAKKVTNNFDRSDIIYSLEEIIISAIQNGQGGYIKECQEAIADIINIYSEEHDPLNKDSIHDPSHPLRMLPDVIERISFSLIDNNMGNLLHYNGHLLRELSGKRYDGKAIVRVEIATAIEHIGIYSLKTNQLDDFYNFIANAVFCLDSSNSYSTVFWGCQLLINATKSKIDKESNRILKMIRDILDSISHAITHEDIPEHAKLQIVSFISSLSWVKVAAAQNKYTEILDLMNKITAKRVRVMVRRH